MTVYTILYISMSTAEAASLSSATVATAVRPLWRWSLAFTTGMGNTAVFWPRVHAGAGAVPDLATRGHIVPITV
jgi:hypothetical protein